VQETVSTVKDTVQDTIIAVKDSVKEGVGAVKDVFDISGHVEQHPWAMFGGSIAVGFVVGRFFASEVTTSSKEASRGASQDFEAWEREGGASETALRRSSDAASFGAHHNGHNGHSEHPSYKRDEPEARPKSSEGLGGWLKAFAPEIEKLKGLAIGALMGTLRETVAHAAPAHVKEPLVDVINSMTEKLGGEPVPEASQEEQSMERTPRWASAT
jgi:hypothetical protein